MSNRPSEGGFHVDPGEAPAPGSMLKPGPGVMSVGGAPGGSTSGGIHVDPGEIPASASTWRPRGIQSLAPVSSMVAGLVDGFNLRGQESQHSHSFPGGVGISDPGPSVSGQQLHDGIFSPASQPQLEEGDQGSGCPSQNKFFFPKKSLAAPGSFLDPQPHGNLHFIGDEVEGVISDSDSSDLDNNQLAAKHFPELGREGWQHVSKKRKANSLSPEEQSNSGRQPFFLTHGEGEVPPIGQPAVADDSSDFGKVMIIEPVGTDAYKTQILGKSMKFYRSVEDSRFGILGFRDLKINFKKKHAVIIMNSSEYITELTKINSLGGVQVLVSQPQSHTTSYGIIHPVGLGDSIEDVKEALQTRCDQAGFNAERVFKKIGKEFIPTRNIKLTFSSGQRPDHIFLGSQRFKVFPYVHRALQCYRCQGFGHIANFCRSKMQKCTICSENHNFKECTKAKVQCANCGGPHSAGYGGCPRWKQAVTAEKIRAVENLSFRDALVRARKENVPIKTVVAQAGPKATLGLASNSNIVTVHEPSNPSIRPIQLETTSQATGIRNICSVCHCTQPQNNLIAPVVRTDSVAGPKPPTTIGFQPDEKFFKFLLELVSAMCNGSSASLSAAGSGFTSENNEISKLISDYYNCKISENVFPANKSPQDQSTKNKNIPNTESISNSNKKTPITESVSIGNKKAKLTMSSSQGKKNEKVKNKPNGKSR